MRVNTTQVKLYLGKLFASVGLILVLVLFFYWWKQASPNRNDAKLQELQKLSSEVPVFLNFQEVANHYSSRPTDAGVYRTYRSSSNYDEVKRFYEAVLSGKGWSLFSEASPQSWIEKDPHSKRLTFRKDDLSIILEYTGSDLDNQQWNYAVNFVWIQQNSSMGR